MIQFNLLPDVKLEYMRAQRTKRMVIGASVAATGTTFVIFALLFMTVNVFQKKNLDDLNDDIKQYSNELKATPDLNKILTIQSQLNAINGLHDQKPEASRLFVFIQKLIPADTTVDTITTDFAENTMSVTGNAPSLDKVNVLVDTFKFVTFKDADANNSKAFSEVVLTQFGRNDEGASYTITFKYDPLIFDIKQAAELSVPSTVTTRSVVEQPADIFKQTPPADR